MQTAHQIDDGVRSVKLAPEAQSPARNDARELFAFEPNELRSSTDDAPSVCAQHRVTVPADERRVGERSAEVDVPHVGTVE